MPYTALERIVTAPLSIVNMNELAEWRANRAPRAGKQDFKRPARTTLSLRRLNTFKLNPPISYQAYLEAYAPWVEVPARHRIRGIAAQSHRRALSAQRGSAHQVSPLSHVRTTQHDPCGRPRCRWNYW